MSNSGLLWKFALIIAVVVTAAAFTYPPGERIALGLDLSGGAHIVMQVETDSALRHEVSLAEQRLVQRLGSEQVRFAQVQATSDTSLRLEGADASRSGEVRQVLQDVCFQWEISDQGGGNWRASMPPALRAAIETRSVDQTVTILRNRVDNLGVREPVIQKQGVDRILIQLPGVEDPERVKSILVDPAKLEWKEVSYPPGVTNFRDYFPPPDEQALLAQFGGTLPGDTQVFPQDLISPDGATRTRIYWPLKKVSVVVGDDLKNASRSQDEWNNPQISFELTQAAGKRFEEATARNLNRKMAIVLGGVDDKEVISAPTIESKIRDQGRIMGSFTIEEAEDLALKLKSGAFPTEVSIIEERVVGPSLGRDSIQSGLKAGLAGFALVLLFMVLYYRLSGVNAVVALGLNVLLVFGALGALPVLFPGAQATLTLPGIAGLILTIGMAVDSNVLIFERIREELKLGKTVRSAVEQGFGRAFTTILDCNVTTLVAAFFLFSYGTGPVQGFAVTLTIGLLASMFTAVFVSRQLFELALSRRGRAASLSI